MKQATLILSFYLITFICLGQKEHLEPVRDFKQYEDFLKDYYDSIFPKIYKGFTETPYARYTSIPSFTREYAFSVETFDNKHFIISNSFSENYWYAKCRSEVKLITKKVEIDNILYSKIGELFQILAKQTKKSKEDLMGDDGVTYYFSTVDKNGNLKIGETWSPDDNSLLGRLVKICDNLHSIGDRKDVSQTDILKEIEELIKELKQ